MKWITAIEAKANILSKGVRISEEVIEKLPSNCLSKRRAYGNPDDARYLKYSLPQEIVIMPDKIISSVSFRDDAEWEIIYKNNNFYLKNHEYYDVPIIFIEKPSFYYMKLASNSKNVTEYVTMISGHNLGIFVNTHCYFATPINQCQYCSIACNTGRPDNLLKTLPISETLEAISIALDNDNGMIDEIFISGGNYNDFDSNFKFYAEFAIKVKHLIDKLKRKINVVLNVFPPNDISLYEILKDSKINMLISTEVFAKNLYEIYCPGKSSILSKDRLLLSLTKAIDVLGKGRVYSIVMQGLEPEYSLMKGIKLYAEMGVCTLVNVFHPDPGTVLYNNGLKPPNPESILKVAHYVSNIYREYRFNTTSIYAGRNSFDKESSMQIV